MTDSRSDHCSVGSGGSILGSSGPECERPGSASKMTTAGESSTGIGQESLFTLTSPNSEGPRLSRLMSFAEVFRARISVAPERGLGSMEPARVFGPSTHDSLANFDPDTSLWKTSQFSLDGEPTEFSGIFPRSGMTRNGIAFQRQPLVPRTGATASGLWPTPMSADGKRASLRFGGGNLILHGAVRLWPTPRASRNENRQTKRSPSQEAGTHGKSLAAEVGGKLNPQWVAWLMGFPIDWTSLPPSETPSSRKSLSGSGEES